MTDCIFCKIISKEIPSYSVWEDEHFFAFLDNFPVQPGHMLIIPKEHVENVFALSADLYKELFTAAKALSTPLQQAMGSARIGMVIEGFGVPHAHLHLVPINRSHDLDSVHTKPGNPEELATLSEKIKKELNKN